MKKKSEVVIIGGGIMGLSLAYNLAKKGVESVVLEKSYLNSGASGRCAGGFRQQWSTRENIEIMIEGVKELKKLTSELSYNTWFRQGGYLFLASTEEEVKMLKKNILLQNSLGVKSKLITPEEAKEIVPYLNINEILAASFNKKDGVIFPWSVIWGYADKCKKIGVEINTFTEVTGIKMEKNKVKKVFTNRGEVETNTVVCAAGAWSPKIAEMVSLKLPNKAFRHEIIATEPLKPFLDPMVIHLKTGMYACQTMKGEVLVGITNPFEKPSYNINSSIEFLSMACTQLAKLMPVFTNIKVMRQWAGFYDVTPDARPILGKTKVEGFILMCGFMGHGFMMGPIMGKVMAEYIAGEKPSISIDKYNLERFEKRHLEEEKVIVG